MKKLFLTALAVSMALMGRAQLVEVASIASVALPQGVTSDVATVSPDGSYAVVGQLSGNRLVKVDFATGATSVITENGNANGVTISPDGNNIVFRTTTFNKNHLRYTGLNAVNLTTGKESQLVKPSRHLNAGVAISNEGVTAVENGSARVKSFAGAKALSMPVASINYGHLDITVNGKTTTLDPQGRGSYLWPSISPDGTQVVYCLSGAGTFVCNIDGTNVRRIGNLRAARWLGNDMVVAMNDKDNGEQITSSEIVVSDLAGTHQTITSADMIALYPSASADGRIITFSTLEGALYVINLK